MKNFLAFHFEAVTRRSGEGGEEGGTRIRLGVASIKVVISRKNATNGGSISRE